jgi:hypothetical protein
VTDEVTSDHRLELAATQGRPEVVQLTRVNTRRQRDPRNADT